MYKKLLAFILLSVKLKRWIQKYVLSSFLKFWGSLSFWIFTNCALGLLWLKPWRNPQIYELHCSKLESEKAFQKIWIPIGQAGQVLGLYELFWLAPMHWSSSRKASTSWSNVPRRYPLRRYSASSSLVLTCDSRWPVDQNVCFLIPAHDPAVLTFVQGHHWPVQLESLHPIRNEWTSSTFSLIGLDFMSCCILKPPLANPSSMESEIYHDHRHIW